MDGEVVTFAESFTGKDEGMSLPKPEGPYVVSASRDAVVVHHADLHSPADALALIRAIREATREAAHLSGKGWWGGKFPRDVGAANAILAECHEEGDA
jgi:hypothetical protein